MSNEQFQFNFDAPENVEKKEPAKADTSGSGVETPSFDFEEEDQCDYCNAPFASERSCQYCAANRTKKAFLAKKNRK